MEMFLCFISSFVQMRRHPLHTLQTFYNILGRNIRALRQIVELHLVLCFYYLTARQLLLQPSTVTHSPSPFGVALSYVLEGYFSWVFLQNVPFYNELRVISVRPQKKGDYVSENFFINARESEEGYWRRFSKTHQMELNSESDQFQMIV